MAKLVLKSAAPDFQWVPDFFQNDGAVDITASTANELDFTANDGFKIAIIGTGLDTNEPISAGGTVTSVIVRNASGSTVLAQFTGLSVDFQSFYYALFGFDNGHGGSGPRPDTAVGILLGAGATILGSGGSETLGGWALGNDIIKGKGGSDYIGGDPGNDKLDGGSGFDTLAYDQTIWNASGFQGVTLDAAAGTATDPWGGHDTFKNFEQYMGSGFADTIKGSNADEEIAGLRGKDTLDGKGGFDRLIYTNDAELGGSLGIKANLAKGKVSDGWGDVDTVKNFESVRGTAQNDTFIGDGNDNNFQGLGGKDTYKGGGGFDFVDFSANDFNDGVNGATVDLSLATNQIIDDGYGKTENAKSIEGLVGTKFADTFTGDSNNNEFHGHDGSDTLSGGGGDDHLNGDDQDDTLNGGSGKDFLDGGRGTDTLNGGTGADDFWFGDLDGSVDVIQDFSAADRIRLWLPEFGNLGPAGSTLDASRFKLGTHATNGTQRIIYDQPNGDLYFDNDGNGPHTQQKWAHLDNHFALTASLFILDAP